MVRSLGERLAHFGCRPKIVKVALNRDDLERYGLPPDVTKATDTRQRKFVERHGDISAELDALPVHILRERIRSEVAARMDLDALNDAHDQDEADRARLVEALRGAR